jgi:hypothetical protein
MSIAAISQSFIAAVRGASPVEAPDRGAHRHAAAREPQGRRHELVDAMSQVLDVGSDATKAQTQAVFRFANALMHDLRDLDGGDERRALGRREWRDLPQRLAALAAAASREPADDATDAALSAVAEAPEPPAVPDLPQPATPISLAVHMAQVPTSHLLEAFVAMQRALGREQDDSSARSALAALATQIASALQPDAPSELPAGSVVNLTA